LEKNSQMLMFEAVLEKKLSQLAGKYGAALVYRIWEEMRIAGGDEAYFRFCGWPTEMTLGEAIGCLHGYCDFIEAMIRKHIEKEKKAVQYIPALFN
jgi:hypothetical protein